MGNDAPYYEKDGRRYERITNILDYFLAPDLVDWKLRVGKKESERVSREALRIGSNLDEAIKADVEGLKLPKLKTFEAKNGFEAYQKWKAAYSPVLTIPNTVYDEDLMIAGTPDLVWADRAEVIDVKGSRYISSNYWLQTEFYGRKLGVRNKAIFRANKQLGIYEYITRPLNDEHWEAVKGAVALYRYHRGEQSADTW